MTIFRIHNDVKMAFLSFSNAIFVRNCVEAHARVNFMSKVFKKNNFKKIISKKIISKKIISKTKFFKHNTEYVNEDSSFCPLSYHILSPQLSHFVPSAITFCPLSYHILSLCFLPTITFCPIFASAITFCPQNFP